MSYIICLPRYSSRKLTSIINGKFYLLQQKMDIVGVVREVLENAIGQRERPYQETFVVSVRFEADETSAAKDRQIFFNLMKCINLSLLEPSPILDYTYRRYKPWLDHWFLSETAVRCNFCVQSVFAIAITSHGSCRTERQWRHITFYERVSGVRSFDYIRIIDRTLVTPSISAEKSVGAHRRRHNSG